MRLRLGAMVSVWFWEKVWWFGGVAIGFDPLWNLWGNKIVFGKKVCVVVGVAFLNGILPQPREHVKVSSCHLERVRRCVRFANAK